MMDGDKAPQFRIGRAIRKQVGQAIRACVNRVAGCFKLGYVNDNKLAASILESAGARPGSVMRDAPPATPVTLSSTVSVGMTKA